jgi:hypothetical protein
MEENAQTMDEFRIPNKLCHKNYKAKRCWKTEEESENVVIQTEQVSAQFMQSRRRGCS